MRRTGGLGIVVVLLSFAGLALGQVPDMPDLDVLFIEQWPVYPGYAFEYPGNVPTLVKPGPRPRGQKPEYIYTKDEYDTQIKTRPAVGETITFTAYVANKGGAPADAAGFVLKLDDQTLKAGTLPPLKPGEKTTVEAQWPYAEGRHYVSISVDPDNKIKEISEENNTWRDPTFGFVLTITAGKDGEYEAFGTTKNLVGTYSFEDWCQAHIAKWREHFRAARYPSTPEGVQADVRFNRIFPLEDGPDVKAYEKRGGWLNWRIKVPSDQVHKSYAAGIDGGLIHELVHQCGVIDSYQIGMGMLDNFARDPETGRTIEIPYSDHRAMHGSIMGGAFRDPLQGAFSEHEAGAFDATLRRWGTHAGYGVYLFDMPASNIVQFLDNQDKPLAGAVLTIWQQWASPSEGNDFSRKTSIVQPKTVRLDDQGCFNLGANPYDTLWVVGGNCVIMYGVRAYGQKEYHFVDMREFNIACWRGDHDKHVFVYHTNIAPLGAPAAPRNLAVDPAGKERGKARLTWAAPDGKTAVKAYRIRSNRDLLCALHEPTFEVLKEIGPDTTDETVELPADADYTWLTVTAVAADGRESACAAPVAWPPKEIITLGLVRPIGTAIGPDGAKYVADNHQGTVFGVDAKGNLLNFSDTAMIGSGTIFGVAVTHDKSANDGHGRLFVVGRGGCGIAELNPTDGKVLRHFAGSEAKSTTPGKMNEAFAIACDARGRLYVSERVTHTVQVYAPTGELLTTLEAGWQDNRGLGVGERDGQIFVAVADAGRRSVTVLKLDPEKLSVIDKNEVKSEAVPLSADFDATGKLYVGTQSGIDRYEGAKRTSHWESRFNRKGHEVWGLQIEGDHLVCTEGGNNEKHWMAAKLSDFRPIE